ncbi:unnamed protein product [Toxocara canis]|uniref:MUTSd domain-containing protein n=1 Tax=Toxocara canis TaxID=6265 RepID=A0A183U034_TOXCA|nr:unnamed protein product [Toxocara canis]
MVPRECIILPSASKSFEDASREEKRMNNLETALKRADITFSEFKNLNAINTEIVDGLLSAKCKGMHISEQQLKCLAALAQHLRITDDVTLYEGRFQLVDYKSAGFMYLDMAAVRALELFSLSYDEGDWMRRPLFDLRRINERLDVVEALCEMSSCRDKLFEDLLRRVPDVASLSRKLLQKKASLQHCYRLYQLVCLLKRFEEVFSEIHASSDSFAPSVNELCLEPVRLAVLQFDKFAALIESTVDVEYFEETGTYRIRPIIDDKLLETSERMKDIEKQCQKELAKVSENAAEYVKLDSNSQYGFFFRVTLKAEKSIRQAGLKILETTKGSGVRFTSKALETLNVEYKELEGRYDAAQSELVKMVVETCGQLFLSCTHRYLP